MTKVVVILTSVCIKYQKLTLVLEVYFLAEVTNFLSIQADPVAVGGCFSEDVHLNKVCDLNNICDWEDVEVTILTFCSTHLLE